MNAQQEKNLYNAIDKAEADMTNAALQLASLANVADRIATDPEFAADRTVTAKIARERMRIEALRAYQDARARIEAAEKALR